MKKSIAEQEVRHKDCFFIGDSPFRRCLKACPVWPAVCTMAYRLSCDTQSQTPPSALGQMQGRSHFYLRL